jgi:Protein of unknown function (DUF4239)
VTDWLHDLSVLWLALVVVAGTLLVTAAICLVVLGLATGERGRAFKAVSPGLLPPLGVVFALLVGFLAAQVWSASDRAKTAVSSEASSLRSVVLLAGEFPGAPETQMRALVRRHVQNAVDEEWPEMAHQDATLAVVPGPLADLLQLALALRPEQPGQTVAQQELVTAVENALDARRQRIIVSESSVNGAKWGAVIALAILTLFGIAFVHSDSRLGAAIAMTLFASAAAVCVVMIAAQARPFAGPFAVEPTDLVEVEPAVR